MSINWTIEAHESVKSTQDIIKGMGDIGQPEGVVVHAREQTDGYGREGREWVSEKGNLYISVLLRPSCSLKDIGQLSLVAGLAVGKTIQAYLENPQALMLKWPNDILINARKCAGLILETGLGENNALKWVALGIGINVKSGPGEIATFIGEHSAEAPKLVALRKTLLENLDEYYALWTSKGFEPIKQDWLSLAHKQGDAVSVKIGDDILEGVFHDIDDTGALLIKDNELRLKTITSGDVYV